MLLDDLENQLQISDFPRHVWLRSPVALNAGLSAVARGERRIWPRALQLLNDGGDWQVGIKLGPKYQLAIGYIGVVGFI